VLPYYGKPTLKIKIKPITLATLTIIILFLEMLKISKLEISK
jgi:hypothetical protein